MKLHPLVRPIAFALMLFAGISSIGCRLGPKGDADLVLLGGNVVTMDPSFPRASAVAIKGDRLVAAGTDRQVRAWVGEGTRVIELAGKTVVPGMIDAHTHFVGIGARKLQVDAMGTTSSNGDKMG